MYSQHVFRGSCIRRAFLDVFRPRSRIRRLPLGDFFPFALLCFALWMVAAPAVWAADYYVDIQKGRNSSGNGLTTAAAWRNITYALIQISGTGHTLHMAPGTYDTTLDPGAGVKSFPSSWKTAFR